MAVAGAGTVKLSKRQWDGGVAGAAAGEDGGAVTLKWW